MVDKLISQTIAQTLSRVDRHEELQNADLELN